MIDASRARPCAILLVDDEAPARRGVRRILEAAGHVVLEAATVGAARETLDVGGVDVVVLDVGLADEDGLTLLTHHSVQARAVAVVVFTASRDRRDMKRALSSGAMSYLVKSGDALSIEAQVESAFGQLQNQRQSRSERDRIERSLTNAVLRWDALPRAIALRLCGAWDLRHIETGAHVRRMSLYTEVIARAVGMPGEEATALAEVAILHDIGKLAIPDAILSKPGQLTEQEFSTMKQHAVEGARMLGGTKHPFLERAAGVALRHHERWNGSGYPDGLVGERCPLDARIVGIADVYDALATSRCYKPAWQEQRIVDYFRAASGKQFDPRLAQALLDALPRLQELARQVPDLNGISDVFLNARSLAAAEGEREQATKAAGT